MSPLDHRWAPRVRVNGLAFAVWGDAQRAVIALMTVKAMPAAIAAVMRGLNAGRVWRVGWTTASQIRSLAVTDYFAPAVVTASSSCWVTSFCRLRLLLTKWR